MNTITRCAVLILLVWNFTLPGWAATGDHKGLVRDVLILSGLEYQIRQMPQQVLAGYDQQRRTLPVEQHHSIRQALATSFDATALERRISQELERSLRQETIQATLDWLKGDLGRRITKLEEAASDVTELLLDISESLTLSIAAAHQASLPASQRTGLEQLRSVIARQRETLRQKLQTYVWLNLLYSYRTLSEGELRQYIAFLDSEAGMAFHTKTNMALKDALETSITHVSRAMIDILKPPAGRKAI